MVRAILEGGVIHPLEDLPSDWCDGRELIVREATETPTAEELDAWSRGVEELATEIPPEDFEALEEALAAADRQAKAIVARQMGPA